MERPILADGGTVAASGGMDRPFTAFWESGRIKFWSRATLAQVFARIGMEETAFDRIGRIAALAKSMVVTFRKDRA